MIKVGDTFEVVKVTRNDYYFSIPLLDKQFVALIYPSGNYRLITFTEPPVLMFKYEVKPIGRLKVTKLK